MDRELGQVVALASLKGNGTPRLLSNGEWAWMVRGRVQAETLDGGRDLVVWSQVCGGLRGTLVTTSGSTVLLSTPEVDDLRISEVDGETVRSIQTKAGFDVRVEAGQTYAIAGPSDC